MSHRIGQEHFGFPIMFFIFRDHPPHFVDGNFWGIHAASAKFLAAVNQIYLYGEKYNKNCNIRKR